MDSTLSTTAPRGDDIGDQQIALVVPGRHQTTNPLVKVAVWTMTVSMGVMTYFVLNTSKYWL